jgi:hypothetical protein
MICPHSPSVSDRVIEFDFFLAVTYFNPSEWTEYRPIIFYLLLVASDPVASGHLTSLFTGLSGSDTHRHVMLE